LQKLKKESEFHKEEAVKSFRQKCFFFYQATCRFFLLAHFLPIFVFSLLTI